MDPYEKLDRFVPMFRKSDQVSEVIEEIKKVTGRWTEDSSCDWIYKHYDAFYPSRGICISCEYLQFDANPNSKHDDMDSLVKKIVFSSPLKETEIDGCMLSAYEMLILFTKAFIKEFAKLFPVLKGFSNCDKVPVFDRAVFPGERVYVYADEEQINVTYSAEPIRRKYQTVKGPGYRFLVPENWVLDEVKEGDRTHSWRFSIKDSSVLGGIGVIVKGFTSQLNNNEINDYFKSQIAYYNENGRILDEYSMLELDECPSFGAEQYPTCYYKAHEFNEDQIYVTHTGYFTSIAGIALVVISKIVYGPFCSKSDDLNEAEDDFKNLLSSLEVDYLSI